MGQMQKVQFQDAIAEIERLDALLSTGETDSEIYKLNQNGGGSISGRYFLSS